MANSQARDCLRADEVRPPAAEGSANSTWFNSYHPYNDHLQFINDLASKNPSNAEVVTSGKSLQGNAITGIHFWGSAGKGKKPAIVLHGTVHAREWIASMVSKSLRAGLEKTC